MVRLWCRKSAKNCKKPHTLCQDIITTPNVQISLNSLQGTTMNNEREEPFKKRF